MLKLYGFKKVNPAARGFTRDLRILWALQEMQLPYEFVGMDHPAQDLSTAAFHNLNPFEPSLTVLRVFRRRGEPRPFFWTSKNKSFI